MMPRDPVKIVRIIEAGEHLRDKHLESVEDQIRRYHGPWWYGRGPSVDEEYDPQNLAYQYVSLVLPTLAWDNPRFEVKIKRGPEFDPVVDIFKHVLDRWAVDTDLQETMEAVAMDFLFAYGVILTEMEPEPEQDPAKKDPAKRPVMVRLNPHRYGMDPFSDTPREARIQWHTWVQDKEDLLEEARQFPDRGWNAEAIERIAADAGIEKLWRDRNVRNMPPREEIVGRQVWIPEWELPEVAKMKPAKRRQFNGTLVDIAVAHGSDGMIERDSAQFIREPRPFFGPAWGPYAIVGAYKVPGKLYPLGPLTAIEGQNRELNEHKRAYLKSARTRKKIGIATDKDPNLSDIITDTPEGEVAVASIENLDRNFREIELGGPTAEQRLTIVGLQADADNALGMSDAKRGEVSGIGTATENAIADASGNQRLSWKKKRFRKGWNDGTRTAGWYMWNSPDFKSKTGPQAGNVEFNGGQPEGQPGAQASQIAFEDLEMSIEIMSTERLDEGVAQARAMQVFGMLTQAIPAIAMAPMADWVEAFDTVGESINLPDLGQKLGIDKIMQAAAQGQLQPPQPQPSGAGQPQSASPQQPRMPPPQVKKGGVAPFAQAQKNQNTKDRMAGVA